MLDHAVKYSDESESIDVELDCEECEAVVRVRSCGPEMPAADVPFVFNRFYRCRQPAGATAGGSGLGLPIAKWIVDSHSWRLELASAARETLVTFRLPLLHP